MLTSSNIQTTFFQKQNIFFTLNEFQRGKADTALLTIYGAILTASRAPPVKIVLLQDYFLLCQMSGPIPFNIKKSIINKKK